jgi:hypothetical protein
MVLPPFLTEFHLIFKYFPLKSEIDFPGGEGVVLGLFSVTIFPLQMAGVEEACRGPSKPFFKALPSTSASQQCQVSGIWRKHPGIVCGQGKNLSSKSLKGCLPSKLTDPVVCTRLSCPS